jgi:effector-binding domain-containing protein
MLENPHLIEVSAARAAVIPVKVRRSDIQQAMGPALRELHAVLAAQHVTPTGPWFAHHARLDDTWFDMEIGVPVAVDVTPAGRVVAGTLPAGRLARGTWRGGYEHLFAAWAELNTWVTAQGLTPGPTLWEAYLVGPETSPAPGDWVTQLNRPLS